MNATTEEGCILTGTTDGAFIARFEGRLTQRSMWNMNHAVERYGAADAPSIVLVDVADCIYMDSTMLGLLARWALTCANAPHGRPILLGLGEGDLAKIFRRMSIDRLFELSDLEPPSVAGTRSVGREGIMAASADSARQVLLAHETLAELSPANAVAFGVLLDILRKDVPHEKPEVTDG